jgi:hypothetical protein
MLAAQIFNGLEAAFWLVLAVLAATVRRPVRGLTRGRQASLVIFLVAFGASDVWELVTAWQQPPAMLAFKAVCLLGLAVTAALIYGERWRQAA